MCQALCSAYRMTKTGKTSLCTRNSQSAGDGAAQAGGQISTPSERGRATTEVYIECWGRGGGMEDVMDN